MKKYRFETKSVDDYRPLIDTKDIQMPWWCSGTGDDHATIVCYLPDEEDLIDYWDDAYNIEIEEVDEIKYSSRFAKPSWIN